MGGRSSKPAPAPKPNATISEKDRAVLELKRMRDRLRKLREGSENIIKRESQLARELLDVNQRKKAVLVLKKKKHQESLLEKMHGQLSNIEEMLQQIESAALNKAIFDAMKVGQATLAALHKEMSLDDVEQLMEDTEEAVRIQQSMSSTLASSLTQQEDADVEAEVAKLMAAMEQAEQEEKKKDDVKTQKKDDVVVVTSTPSPIAQTDLDAVAAADKRVLQEAEARLAKSIESLPEPPKAIAEAAEEAEEDVEEEVAKPKPREVELA